MFRTLANAWKLEDLRKKMLFTLFIILIYRIGACLPVPFVNSSVFSYYLSSGANASGSILGFLNVLSGNSFAQATLFALGVSPYITASIVIQLLTVAIPPLERWAKQGDEGRKKITALTRYVTVAIALLTSIGYYLYLKNSGSLLEGCDGFFYAVVIVACYCAGSSLVMWLAEKINDRGIGNGISLILFANIISRGAGLLDNLINTVKEGIEESHVGIAIGFVVFTVVLMLAMIWFIIFISDSERRIPVQYAKKVVGRKMYGGQNTNLPIKLNMTGVMPIIFANSIVTIPATLSMFFSPKPGTAWYNIVKFCSSTSWFYAVMTLILIVAFAYFYVAISFNPIEVAGNLQKNGGSVPGIRPGKATSDYISKVLSRITFIGALALAIIAVVPLIIQLIVGAIANHVEFFRHLSFSELAFGGTSIIIVVGVILETVREIEGQMTMRHYKGFL